jgi:hypothetical protein
MTSSESAGIVEPAERIASAGEQSQVLQGEPPSGEIQERGIVPKLAPSTTAAPPPTGMAPPPPGPLLPSPDFELAFYHAPIHYQDTNSAKAPADYIARFDYDGDWIGWNNWDNLMKFPLSAHVYYSVVETCTHWYLVYAFFHPQDWSNASVSPLAPPLEHENDMEGVLSIIRKDGTRFGRLEGMVTTFHHDFYSYTPTGSPLRDGPALNTGQRDDFGMPIKTRQDIDGHLRMQLLSDQGGYHPLTNQEDKGHGIKAFPSAGDFLSGNGGDGIIYVPSRTIAGVPRSGNDRNAPYMLLDIFFPPGGLWDHQRMDFRDARDSRLPGDTYYSWATFRGDKSGGCGASGRGCSENSPHPPWGWDDTGWSSMTSGDIGVYTGELALDPAHLASVYFTGAFSEQYLRNKYLSDLRLKGTQRLARRPQSGSALVQIDDHVLIDRERLRICNHSSQALGQTLVLRISPL